MARKVPFLWKILTGVFLLSLVLLAILYFKVKPQPGSFELEIAKAILQVGVAAIIGAGISVLFFDYQRERQKLDRAWEKAQEYNRKCLENREDLLRATLARARESYDEVKKARRLLRARAIEVQKDSEKQLVVAAAYDTHMDVIIDAQIEFRTLRAFVDNSKREFSKHKDLVAALESMQTCLTPLITEYENSRKIFAGKIPSMELSALTKLKAFIGPYKDSTYRTVFMKSYRDFQQGIRADLLDPRLPEGPAAA